MRHLIHRIRIAYDLVNRWGFSPRSAWDFSK